MPSLFSSLDNLKIIVIAAVFIIQTLLLSFVLRRFLFYAIQKRKYPEQTFLKDYLEHLFYCLILIILSIFSLFYIYVKDLQIFLLLFTFAFASSFLISIIHLLNSDDVDLVKSQSIKKSIGALWAHGAFKAYFEVIFQEWSSAVEKYEATGKQLTSKKLILICPLSCNNQGKLSEIENIEEVGILTFCAFDQGANINREYRSPIYKLGGKDSNVFISAQYPSSFGTLWEVKDCLRNDIWLYHRNCFISTLKELLKYFPCTILEYNDLDADNKEPLDIFLLKQLNIKKEK